MLGKELRRNLSDHAVRIDHIGSTSVPGLAAKDIIDIQVTVESLKEEIAQVLVNAGYLRSDGKTRDHVPPGSSSADDEWDKWLFKPPPDHRPANIHVRVTGRLNQHYAILFRDYLRSHPSTARAYGELKIRLSKHLADPNMYSEVKDPAVDLIYLSAEEWAGDVQWQPGPTDC